MAIIRRSYAARIKVLERTINEKTQIMNSLKTQISLLKKELRSIQLEKPAPKVDTHEPTEER